MTESINAVYPDGLFLTVEALLLLEEGPTMFKSDMIAVVFAFEVGPISDYSSLARTLDLGR